MDLNATPLQAMVHAMGERAREASRALACATTAQKNRALEAAADALVEREKAILSANAQDVKAARTEGNDDAFIDRLSRTAKAIEAMAEGLREVAKLPDPVGEISGLAQRPSGIRVGRMRVPLGVIAIIYEARPNVTADAGSLCLKSGNACILRGGSEAIQLVDTPDRAVIDELVALDKHVDAIVPRGGKGLIERVSKQAKVPVIKHLDGICHVFIDAGADPAKAVAIADNAKTQRYGTCNTMETLLVARAMAETILPEIGRIYEKKGVEMRACEASLAILKSAKVKGTVPATEDDFHTEYLAPVVSIRVVEGLDEAIAH